MKIRSFFFSLMAVLFSLSLSGQASNLDAIQSKLSAFIEYSNQNDWDKAFDMIYPKLFTKVSRQELIEVMTSMEEDGMSIQMSNLRVTSTSAPMTEGNETFVRVEYTADLTVKIAKNSIYDAPKPIYAMTDQFQTSYGDQNVKWDAEAGEFLVKARKAVIAINPGTGDWKLIEINLDQPELMQYLFSPAVMNALVQPDKD